MTLSLFKRVTSLTDEELMRRVAGNDDDKAFDELYHRHARRLMGFFYRQMGDDASLAADYTQDTFLRIWSARVGYNGAAFRTWLYCIAYNLCKNHYRHASYEQAYETHVYDNSEEAIDEDITVRIDKAAFDSALQLELTKLSPPNRLLFSLRFEEDLTVPQMATILNIPEGTVKSRLHSLTQTLKTKLLSYGNI